MSLYWLCVNMGSDECGEIHTLECMKTSMRELREDAGDEWPSIREGFRKIGCFYCIGELPGCGFIRMARRVRV